MIIQMDSSSKHKKGIRRIICKESYPKDNILWHFWRKESEYATIVQSGKIKALAALAESNISPEELEYYKQKPDAISRPCPFAKWNRWQRKR
jgi:hypothetical protein